MTKAGWIQKRKAELLPVGYFHNVFTLPHELNPVILCNKKLMLKILFKAVSETLIQFGRNPKNGLGGKLGFLAVLHTWDQNLMDHFHLHCVIAGGALSLEKGRWISARDDFLFSVKALSMVFRGKFIDLLKHAFKDGDLIFPGETALLGTQNGFSRLIKGLRKKKWVVYCKKPFAGPEKVLEYLGRYTHKVAISNNRIVNVRHGRVSFTYRDRRDGDTVKTMTLEAEEFIRRFLLHVLPSGFVRIRHYGFLANRSRKQNLQLCREFLGDLKQQPVGTTQFRETPEKNHQQLMLELTGIDITLCPCCKKGSMVILYEILPLYKPQYLDSS
jgi:hypothetical protein